MWYQTQFITPTVNAVLPFEKKNKTYRHPVPNNGKSESNFKFWHELNFRNTQISYLLQKKYLHYYHLISVF